MRTKQQPPMFLYNYLINYMRTKQQPPMFL